MTATPPQKKRGRPKGSTNKHIRAHSDRARALFLEHGGTITYPKLHATLLREGFPEVSTATLLRWLRDLIDPEHADQVSPNPPIFPIANELRKAAPHRVGAMPEADRIAAASRAVAILVERAALHAASKFEKVKIETPEDAERFAGALKMLIQTCGDGARMAMDLRAPVTMLSNFDEPPPPKPPIDREAEAQEDRPFAGLATSNFAKD